MARITRLAILFILSLLIFTLAQAAQPISHRSSRARAFIQSKCQTTLYRDLCVRSLSYYINSFSSTLSHKQLVQIALKVTLAKAESTRAYVTKVGKELKQTKASYPTIEECLSQINDGVDQLTKSIKETQNIKEDGETSNFPWHASNVQTWMSTALTDSSMCMDGFLGRAIGGKRKALIKAKVLNLQQVTSNTLALFNKFAEKYRSHVKKPKV